MDRRKKNWRREHGPPRGGRRRVERVGNGGGGRRPRAAAPGPPHRPTLPPGPAADRAWVPGLQAGRVGRSVRAGRTGRARREGAWRRKAGGARAPLLRRRSWGSAARGKPGLCRGLAPCAVGCLGPDRPREAGFECTLPNGGGVRAVQARQGGRGRGCARHPFLPRFGEGARPTLDEGRAALPPHPLFFPGSPHPFFSRRGARCLHFDTSTMPDACFPLPCLSPHRTPPSPRPPPPPPP